jgi:hypothetical protein
MSYYDYNGNEIDGDSYDKKAVYGSDAMDFSLQLEVEREFAEAMYEARDRREWERTHR